MRQYFKFAMNKLKPSKVIQDIYGLSYFDSRVDALTRHIAQHEVFGEYKELDDLITKYQVSFGTAIDVGANIGLISLPLSKRFCKVVSFEPDPNNFRVLKKNLSLNQSVNIKIHQVAVGDSPKKMELSVNRVIDGEGMINTGLSSLCEKNRIYSKKLVKVDVVVIDDYCSNNGIHDLDFLKIDTEGYEYFTLLGAIETIKSSLPTIFYEFSLILDARMGVENRKKSFKLLHDLGYIHYYLNGSLYKKMNYDDIASVRGDINLFAVHGGRV
ncbi:MAG: FkbM family methyltransferase [Oceanospirillaceae bacterium]